MNREIEKAGTKIEYIVSHPEEYTSVDVEVRKVLKALRQQERERIKRAFFTYLFHNSIKIEQYEKIWEKIIKTLNQ